MTMADTVVVLDFETTGLSPDNGDRAIEIGAVKIEQGEITDRFQALMNPGFKVNGFIENYTGITNAMLADAPPRQEVMNDFCDFVGNFNMVAHNASFDKRFLDAEYAQISRHYSGEFSCSLLAARRIFQQAPNHKLGTLVRFVGVQGDGNFHRALYDAEMTVHVWLAMLGDIQQRYGLAQIPFALIQKLNKTPSKAVHRFLSTR